MIGVGISPPLALPRGIAPTGGGSGNTGGPMAPTYAALPVTPAARWHPAGSTVSVAGGKVTAATDMMGLADVMEGGAGIGPQAMVDGTGRPFWRFEGDAYLTVAQSLMLSTQDCGVFFVGRFHKVSNKCPIFSLGSQAGGNGTNTLGAAFEASSLSLGAPMLRGFSYPRDASEPEAEWMVAGSQMQVAGMTGRAAADGGTRLWMNERSSSVQQPFPVVDVQGAEIGRYSGNPENSGRWGTFDLYELVVYDHFLTDAEGDAISMALQTHYSIPAVSHQLVLEGDSIMQGTGSVTSGLAANMILTEPGTTWLTPDWRVVNMGASGNKISNLVSKRDAAGSWAHLQLPGRNVVAFEIGRNDLSSSMHTAQDHYTNVVQYLVEANTGLLPLQWEARVMSNIATSVSIQPKVEEFRALLRDTQFYNDTQSNAGQSYEGLVTLIETDLIMHVGQTVFATSTDAANTSYYAGDVTHPSLLGAQVRATGGDTPQFGIAAGLRA